MPTREFFTLQLLRRLDIPLPSQEGEPKPTRSSGFDFQRFRRYELEAPIDIPNWLTRGKVLEFQKDRDLFSTGRFRRGYLNARKLRGCKWRTDLSDLHDVLASDDLLSGEPGHPRIDPGLSEEKVEYHIPQGVSTSSSMVPEVVYTPLPDGSWFRLLHIQPNGDVDAPITCHLHSIPRKDACDRYEALSYAWDEGGQPKEPKSSKENERSNGHREQQPLYIICNGHEVPVKRNLYDALLHLRHSSVIRAIWVDAVCINQEDSTEVSHQIQAMTEIYGQAHRTVVWLGVTPPTSTTEIYEPLNLPIAEAAMAVICHVVKRWDASLPARYFVTGPPRQTEDMRQADMDSDFARNLDDFFEARHASWDQSALQPLRQLFSATWFGRKWVIQEVSLSRSIDVLFRGCRISWRWIGLAAAILRMRYDNVLRRSALNNIYHAYLMFRLSDSNGLGRVDMSFAALLRLTAGFQTSEPKDTFFALFGLQTRDHHPTMQPLFTGAEYHLSYEEICIRLARALLETGRSSRHPLSILADAGISSFPEAGTSVPSWVPSWRGNRPGLLSPWSLDDRFEADKGLELYLDTSAQNEISVQGIRICNVLRCCDVLIEDEDSIAASIDWLDQFSATLPLLQTYSRTLCAGRDTNGRRETDRNAMVLPMVAFAMYGMVPGTTTFEWINTCRKQLPEADQNPWKDADKSTRAWNGRWVAARERFSFAASLVAPRRRLFLSASGHLGLGPGDLSPGDEIWVLGGEATPLVLRPVDNGKKVIVGPCYIDDVMEGEAVVAAKVGQRHLGALWSEDFESEGTGSAPEDFEVRRITIQ
ncbi:heterokaryon incompatibility protein-domain-containing protein [Podospora aff. communis PSN243]|uniref:Heterokaryon incompatibility protein-domain-containing protein n=1 Tax=Podospora aff. communis PSN243 TaxID=3040156 RepID=A0AAV9GAQ3_9PEZI|nr:heterokaryon incompatibility protein-domain-containing protein [Podospora aff. communis PSN243]